MIIKKIVIINISNNLVHRNKKPKNVKVNKFQLNLNNNELRENHNQSYIN